jgi:hypothetical protein
MTSGESTDPPAEPGEAGAAPAAEPAYAVGHGRPPQHSRFQPGRSGNPKGRPRGVRSVGDLVRKIVAAPVTISEGGRTRRAPRLEAILLRIAADAVRGDVRALRLLLQLTERYGEDAPAAADTQKLTAEDLAILRRYLPDPGETAGASDAAGAPGVTSAARATADGDNRRRRARSKP